MTTWKAEPDSTNPGHWRIIITETRKTICYGLSQRDAELFVSQRNKKQKKQPQT